VGLGDLLELLRIAALIRMMNLRKFLVGFANLRGICVASDS
jgi:hypothetical protein